MKYYQDTETGLIHAFEDGIDPRTLNNLNIPATLSENIKQKPDESYVWHQGDWIKLEEAPLGYTQPVSSVPSHSPAWMAYLLPYAAVHRDEASGLNISLDQINANSYAGTKLAEVVALLPLASPSGLPALISYDGAIAIPQCEDFPSNVDGVSKLNEILCSLMLGGVHTEVLHSDALVVGSLQDGVRFFAYTPSLHTQLRLNCASINDRLQPLMLPRVLMVEEIRQAYSQGQQVIKAIHNLSPFFLLNGYTAMVYRNNSDALNNLWIAVEQLTEYLWTERYVKNRNAFTVRLAKCHDQLKRQNKLDQIWAKHQLLRLSKIISKECHKALCQARKRRNDLVHEGIVPDIKIVEALWVTLPELIEVASGIRALGVRRLLGGGENNWAIPVRTNFDEWAELATKV
ncbi:MAG: hypothetical protein CVU33_06275 [Betaproteobacteria bacterium HGW-Betaproteobacteria-6]|jgi:hypothetical protein|nr:MAG: hypothetical protein CVU33_06275 [Betaproteobacteria bacterium HGW-Betaproteobacteria-6]